MLSVICLALGALAGGENLLVNGDFENGGKRDVAAWERISPPAENADFELVEGGAHGGESCARLTTTVGAGYSSFTQSLAAPPRKAAVVRLEGWIKAEKLGASGAASLMLLMFDPSDDSKSAMHFTKGVTTTGEWTRVELVAPVLAGNVTWLVRCGMTGVGSALFDDVVLTAIEGDAKDFAAGLLAVHRGDFYVEASGSSKNTWLRCSIPFAHGAQTPLALRVTSTPPDSVAELALIADRENRPLEIKLGPGAKVRVELQVETLVWIADREPSDGVGVELAKKSKLPKDVALFLEDAPGVDVGDPRIVAAAKALPRADLAQLMRGATKFLDEALEYDGGSSQGARECLDSKKAVCTGFANVATALLVAADVPTRTLACTMTSARSQEHYIVESWTPKLGWVRMESTAAQFPLRERQNLIVRIVYPDAERSPYDVPLYVEHSPNVEGGFDKGDDMCWQGGEELGSYVLATGEAKELESASRKAFEALVKKPAASSKARFAPAAASSAALKDVLAAVDSWLAR